MSSFIHIKAWIKSFMVFYFFFYGWVQLLYLYWIQVCVVQSIPLLYSRDILYFILPIQQMLEIFNFFNLSLTNKHWCPNICVDTYFQFYCEWSWSSSKAFFSTAAFSNKKKIHSILLTLHIFKSLHLLLKVHDWLLLSSSHRDAPFKTS